MHIELGKIQKASFGRGGYQDAMVGFTIQVGGKSWGSVKFYEGGWSSPSEEGLKKENSPYKWTHEGRINQLGRAAWEVFEFMKKANVDSLDKLEGMPIKASFESPIGKLIKIEILEEVL